MYKSVTTLSLLLLGACSTAAYAVEADEQVYAILAHASERVTGEAKTFPIGRRVDTLRARVLRDDPEIELGLLEALDVAAENSRDFARQKESLYIAGLRLTREAHDFALRYGGGGSADVDGVDDDSADARLSDDLSASLATVSGARIVAGFAQDFMRSLIRGGTGWDASSLLSLTVTQPLLRGLGPAIVREPLTQAEREVVYSVRDFERFRAELAVDVVADYYDVAQRITDLESAQQNYESVRQSRRQIEALAEAGRRAATDTDRAQQNELSAENRLVNDRNQLDAALDRFKLTLGLPVDTRLRLDRTELDRVQEQGLVGIELAEDDAIAIALARRYDYRTVLDSVEDAYRGLIVAEDALNSSLDFSAAVSVPTEPDKPFVFDWSKVRWAAGFDLDLALDKLPERNSYRQAMIALDAAFRAREQLEDQVKSQVRTALRNIESRRENYRIQELAEQLAQRRVESATLLYEAGRGQAFEILDAQTDLLDAQLGLTGALVDYTVARLQLLRDLEALSLTPKGLRVDLSLPLPEPPAPDALRRPGGR